VTALLIDAPPVSELTRRGARLRCDRLRGRLETAWDELQWLLERDAWSVLGYADVAAWLQGEFGDLRLIRLDREQRADVVTAMHAQGMSYAKVAAALGISVGAAHKADRNHGKRLAVVPEQPAKPARFIDRVIAAVPAEGATCQQVKASLHEGHQRVSAALSRAVRSGRLVYVAPEKRGQHGTYLPAT
jgi:transposase